jgi:hypothetical protein
MAVEPGHAAINLLKVDIPAVEHDFAEYAPVSVPLQSEVKTQSP